MWNFAPRRLNAPFPLTGFISISRALREELLRRIRDAYGGIIAKAMRTALRTSLSINKRGELPFTLSYYANWFARFIWLRQSPPSFSRKLEGTNAGKPSPYSGLFSRSDKTVTLLPHYGNFWRRTVCFG
jgi:hypothetical protein